MEEGGFGVSVDLSEWFSDARAQCVVWVEPRRRVRWLARRLRRRLRLRGPVALSARAGLLLPGDPLRLLQPGDTLRAIPMEDWFNDYISSEEETEHVKHTSRPASPHEPSQCPAAPQPAPSGDHCLTELVCAVPENNATPESPVPQPVSPVNPEPVPPDSLVLRKQQALALLERLSANGGERGEERGGERGEQRGAERGGERGEERGLGSRPRRRRVRRRTRPTHDTTPEAQEWCLRSSSVESVVRNAALPAAPAPAAAPAGAPAPAPAAPPAAAPPLRPRLVRAL